MRKSIWLILCVLRALCFSGCVVVNFVNGGAVYGKGVLENPVNVQEIDLRNIDDITVLYRSERVTFLKNNSDSLIIREYMSKDSADYYARITNSGNKLAVEAGRRPFFGSFTARIEVYIPVSDKNITIRTSSGSIEGNDEYTAGSIKMESSSGSIRLKKVNGNARIHTNSGSIVLGSINGNVSAEASSGSIELESVNGTIDAKASSGRINCTAGENTGDISITSSSGSVALYIPENFAFKFTSRTSSGSLRTPFSDKLSSPFTDRNSIQGVIGVDNTSEGQNINNINIKTSSGSIRVNWVD
jgi:DUF4097 and DUF4098 domain-containing protein YvlB